MFKVFNGVCSNSILEEFWHSVSDEVSDDGLVFWTFGYIFWTHFFVGAGSIGSRGVCLDSWRSSTTIDT